MRGVSIHPLIRWTRTLSADFSHRTGKFSTILLAASLQIHICFSGDLHARPATSMNSTEVLNRFESLPFNLEVELGGFELSVRELLDLKLGTVLRTNHPTSAPLMLRAGGTPVATAEIVIVKDALSVRIKEILGSSTKIEKAPT